MVNHRVNKYIVFMTVLSGIATSELPGRAQEVPTVNAPAPDRGRSLTLDEALDRAVTATGAIAWRNRSRGD